MNLARSVPGSGCYQKSRRVATVEKMTDTDIQEQAISAMVIMNAAITNIRLYPPSSPIIAKAIDRVYETVNNIFEEQDSVVFAQSEQTLLVSGQPLNEKDQKKPQVQAFLELLLSFGIQSIAFEKGLDKTALRTFLETVSNKPDDVRKDGGLKQIVAVNNLSHIHVDQTVYVAVHEDQQILASLDIKDDQILKYMLGDGSVSDIDPQKVKEMAKDPEWISRVFQSGMNHLAEQKGITPDIKLSENFVHMLRTLDNIADKVAKEEISQQAAKSIADMDVEVISMVLAQNMEGLLGEELIDHIVNKMDDDKFERVAARVKRMHEKATMQDAAHGPCEIESTKQAYETMMSSDRGRQLQSKIKERIVHEKEEKDRQIAHLKEAINRLLKGHEEPFLDTQVMHSLPGVVRQLFNKEKNQVAEAIMDKLGDGLLSKNPDARARVSEALSHILVTLTPEQRTHTMGRLSDRLLKWIELETSSTSAYEQICVQLQDLAQTSIRNGRFADCHSILEVLNDIHSGKVKKDEPIQALTGNVLRGIATEELLNILLNEFQTNELGKRKDASGCLARLGAIPVDSLLDILLESQDRSERSRILQLVSEIGPVAGPALTERVRQRGPWYYLRNLALLLGNVGSEVHLEILKPLLHYEDIRVQRETLNSIYKTGGQDRAEILLSFLPSADDRLKSNTVAMLGALKCHDAVHPMLELLNSKSLFASKLRDELEEQICIALGHIGSKDAISALSSIASKKGFLPLSSFSKNVKAAASEALEEISAKQGQ